MYIQHLSILNSECCESDCNSVVARKTSLKSTHECIKADSLVCSYQRICIRIYQDKLKLRLHAHLHLFLRKKKKKELQYSVFILHYPVTPINHSRPLNTSSPPPLSLPRTSHPSSSSFHPGVLSLKIPPFFPTGAMERHTQFQLQEETKKRCHYPCSG